MLDPIQKATAAALKRRAKEQGTTGATYTPKTGEPLTLDVTIERDAEAVGEYAEASERRTYASLLTDDVPRPRRGDQITVATGRFAGTYTIERRESNNGYISRCIVL